MDTRKTDRKRLKGFPPLPLSESALAAKEDKKRAIEMRRKAHIALQRKAAERKKANLLAKIQGQNEADKESIYEKTKTIDAEIKRLESLPVWVLSANDREERLKQLKELNAKKKQLFETAQGRKLFVGKLSMDDLVEKFVMDPPMMRKLIGLRKKEIENKFASYGILESFKWLSKKGCAIVIYVDAKSAEACIGELKDYTARKEWVRGIVQQLKNHDQPKCIAPSPSFYVRWPQNYTTLTKNGGVDLSFTPTIGLDLQPVDAAASEHPIISASSSSASSSSSSTPIASSSSPTSIAVTTSAVSGIKSSSAALASSNRTPVSVPQPTTIIQSNPASAVLNGIPYNSRLPRAAEKRRNPRDPASANLIYSAGGYRLIIGMKEEEVEEICREEEERRMSRIRLIQAAAEIGSDDDDGDGEDGGDAGGAISVSRKSLERKRGDDVRRDSDLAVGRQEQPLDSTPQRPSLYGHVENVSSSFEVCDTMGHSLDSPRMTENSFQSHRSPSLCRTTSTTYGVLTHLEMTQQSSTPNSDTSLWVVDEVVPVMDSCHMAEAMRIS